MQWITDHVVDLLEAPRVREGRTLIVPGDRDAQVWRVSVVRGADPVPLTGETVQAFFQRPDGVTVVVAGSVSGNVVTVTVPRDACLAAGQLRAMLCLGDRVTVQNVQASSIIEAVFMVQPGIGEVLVDPAEEFADITTLSGRVDDAEAAIEANADAIEGNAEDISAIETAMEARSWTELGRASGVNAGSSGYYLPGIFYRQEIGGHMVLRANIAVQYSGSQITLTSAALPSDLLPGGGKVLHALGAVSTGTKFAIARFFISGDGYVKLEKVQDAAVGETTTSHQIDWCSVQFDWYL